MDKEADISETQALLNYSEKVFSNLLKDHTTQQNIYWATDSYKDREGYTFFDPITIDKITGDNDMIIRPRAVKSREEQTQRAKDKAEGFTPSWICNAQNNLIDEAWFGRRDHLFNAPDPDDPHGWINNEEKISFPEGRTWKDYVADMRLEMTCGEAPYLVNRYDAVTGEYNGNVRYRIGMLDRKLRLVSENVDDVEQWKLWGKIALRCTYGFEWQGDNLLLAREALFYTFAEHFIDKFGEQTFKRAKGAMMKGVAYIISYNIWQMDGLTFGLPGHADELNAYQEKVDTYHAKLAQCKELKQKMEDSLKNTFFGPDNFNDPEIEEPVLEPAKPYERYCLVKDFMNGIDIHRPNLSAKSFHDGKAPKVTFESIVNKNKKR